MPDLVPFLPTWGSGGEKTDLRDGDGRRRRVVGFLVLVG